MDFCVTLRQRGNPHHQLFLILCPRRRKPKGFPISCLWTAARTGSLLWGLRDELLSLEKWLPGTQRLLADIRVWTARRLKLQVWKGWAGSHWFHSLIYLTPGGCRLSLSSLCGPLPSALLPPLLLTHQLDDLIPATGFSSYHGTGQDGRAPDALLVLHTLVPICQLDIPIWKSPGLLTLLKLNPSSPNLLLSLCSWSQQRATKPPAASIKNGGGILHASFSFTPKILVITLLWYFLPSVTACSDTHHLLPHLRD